MSLLYNLLLQLLLLFIGDILDLKSFISDQELLAGLDMLNLIRVLLDHLFDSTTLKYKLERPLVVTNQSLLPMTVCSLFDKLHGHYEVVYLSLERLKTVQHLTCHSLCEVKFKLAPSA